MIAIYTGEGTIWQGEIPGRWLSASDIIEGRLQEYSLLIMPGGRDRPYAAALNGPANAKIRAFVEQGGTYLGICAGAYYGAARVAFDQGFPLQVCEERELAFFQGTAVGPAYGKGTFAYGSEQGARRAKLGTAEGTCEAYYNGGCTFEGDLSCVQIHARYLDLPGEPPAIIECKVGQGRAILSGVHLEKQGDRRIWQILFLNPYPHCGDMNLL